ncbi:MAG: hypothetical protein K6T83_21665 [Alicyclobacillus sp.]|nr:hypothetical protein [Alicyclobacillus sp.]
MVELRPVVVSQLQGPYSYEHHTEPEVSYDFYLKDRNIHEWLEHALQLVTPYTQVRITVEVWE